VAQTEALPDTLMLPASGEPQEVWWHNPPSPLKIVGWSDHKILSILNDPKPYVNFRTFFERYAVRFQGTPYGAGGKGTRIDQTLINVEELDCVTFVENILALALTQKQIQQTPNFPRHDSVRLYTFAHTLNQIRYWQGENCSKPEDRMHYFTAALNEFQKYGWVFNVATGGAGSVFYKKIDYITSNPKRYNIDNRERMLQQERDLTFLRRRYFHLNQLYMYEAIAQPGDIISLATDVPGLDVSHTGFIDLENGVLKFTHSTAVGKRLQVRADFCDYMAGRTSIIGFFVYRPTF
jgi:hypothetical protein